MKIKKQKNLSTIKELRCRILSDGAMNFFRNKSLTILTYQITNTGVSPSSLRVSIYYTKTQKTEHLVDPGTTHR